jgi:hypothetical protein
MIFKKHKLKQEALLRRALKEEGLLRGDVEIKVDHLLGKSTVNGIEVGLIYPKSFIRKSKKLHVNKKRYDFYFNGNMDQNGDRKKLLSPFIDLKKSKIVESNFGRNEYFKSFYNSFYYRDLSLSTYGLCPHQADWPGPKDAIWTYRFIECCLVKTMPIVFIETPLGKDFIEGFNFITDVDILNNFQGLEEIHSSLEENFSLVSKKFFLGESISAEIMKSYEK